MKKLQYNSPVILTFFLLSLGVLLLDWITGGWTTLHAFCVYRSSLADPLFYVRLFGHVLGHADFDHFLGNMLLLLVIGPPLEEKYGSRTLLAGILLTAGVSGRGGRASRTSPRPPASAVPPRRQKGTSEPARSAAAKSASSPSGAPVRSFSVRMTAAASEEPPPRPAQTGICLVIRI